MRCAVHRDTEAIAICRGCFQGVCPTCAVPCGRSVACSAECAEEAARSLRIVAATRRNVPAVQRTQAVCFLILALGTTLGAVIATDVGRWILGIASGLMFAAAFRYFRLAARWRDV